jgi:hypothetical protein
VFPSFTGGRIYHNQFKTKDHNLNRSAFFLSAFLSDEMSATTSSDISIFLVLYMLSFVMTFIVAIGCFRMVQIHYLSTPGQRVNAMNAPAELPTDNNNKLCEIQMSTLAERRQAILALFETSQVTMVSKEHTVTVAGARHFTEMRMLTSAYLVDPFRK